MINFDKIIDKIFVGTCPTNKVDIQRLKQAGFTAILNLQSDTDFDILEINWPKLERSYQEFDITVYRIPIIDFDDDDLIQHLPLAARSLEKLALNDHCVYVHCTAGKQRSPSAVIGYLAWHRKFGLHKALDLVLAARNCDPPINVLEKVDTLVKRSNS